MNSKKTIMIADDVDMNRSVIKRFLAREYVVLEANDGEQALSLIEEHEIDGLILDIIMPKVDGIEVLKKIRANPEYGNMAILVATSTKEKTERMALEYGADDVVAKPYDPLVIRKRLENVLAKKQFERENGERNLSQLREECLQACRMEYQEQLESQMKEILVNIAYMKRNHECEQVVQEGIDRIEGKALEIQKMLKE